MIVNYELIPREQIHSIKHLWEKLNRIHLNDSLHFKTCYREFTFEKRMEGLLCHSGLRLHIEIVRSDTNEPIGYCLTSIDDNNMGEIQSLYLDEVYRGTGIGKALTEHSLEWMRANDCKRIQVVVAGGHEAVLPFYEKFGFFVRRTVLEQIPKE